MARVAARRAPCVPRNSLRPAQRGPLVCGWHGCKPAGRARPTRGLRGFASGSGRCTRTSGMRSIDRESTATQSRCMAGTARRTRTAKRSAGSPLVRAPAKTMSENGECMAPCGASLRPCSISIPPACPIRISANKHGAAATRVSTGCFSRRSAAPAFIAGQCARRRPRSAAMCITTQTRQRRKRPDSGRVCAAGRSSRRAMNSGSTAITWWPAR